MVAAFTVTDRCGHRPRDLHCAQVFVLMIYPEAIMICFLYSVSYRAHGEAIVAVFCSGLSVVQHKGGHRTVAQHKAIAQHKCVGVQVCEQNDCGGC